MLEIACLAGVGIFFLIILCCKNHEEVTGDIIGSNFVSSLLQLQIERGRNFEVKWNGKRIQVFSNPQDIKLILGERPEKFGRLEKWREPLKELGGVLFNEGITWKQLRQPYEEVVSRQNIAGYYEMFASTASNFLGSVSSGGIDMFSFFADFSLQLTSRVVYNYALEDHEKMVLLGSMVRIFKQLPRPFEDYSAKGKEMLREYLQYKKMMQPMLKKAATDSLCFGFHLLQMIDNPEHASKLLFFFPINIAFPLAAALTWMTVETIQNQLIEKVRAGGEKFSEYVMLEALRLHPTGPGITLTCLEDSNINGLNVNKGASVYVFLQPTFQDSDVFSNPREFAPERWENPNLHRGYFGFGFGKRSCPGKSFTSQAVQVIFRKLFEAFEISVDTRSIQEEQGFITYPCFAPAVIKKNM